MLIDVGRFVLAFSCSVNDPSELEELPYCLVISGLIIVLLLLSCNRRDQVDGVRVQTLQLPILIMAFEEKNVAEVCA